MQIMAGVGADAARRPTLQRASHHGRNSLVKSSSRSAIRLATGEAVFTLETRFLTRPVDKAVSR
jgi:hypothetical protein